MILFFKLLINEFLKLDKIKSQTLACRLCKKVEKSKSYKEKKLLSIKNR